MALNYLPKLLLTYIVAVFAFSPAQSQVGINTTTPNGILEISSTNSGVVLPRLVLTRTDVMLPATNPQGGPIPAGTVVYNTNTTIDSIYSVYPGMYVWDGGNPGKWIKQFTLSQAAVYKQPDADLDLRTSSSGGYESVPLSGNSFSAKYTGFYKIEVGVNYGGGYAKTPTNMNEVNIAAQTGTFRFTFGVNKYLLPTKAFSASYNSGSNIYAIWRQDAIIFYVFLNRNDIQAFSLDFDQDPAPEFLYNGNAGVSSTADKYDGLGWIGDDIPCSVEITYIGVEL